MVKGGGTLPLGKRNCVILGRTSADQLILIQSYRPTYTTLRKTSLRRAAHMVFSAEFQVTLLVPACRQHGCSHQSINQSIMRERERERTLFATEI